MTWPTQQQQDDATNHGIEYALAEIANGNDAPDDSPLSGEWADSMTPRKVAGNVGYQDTDDQDYAEGETELADAWEMGYEGTWRTHLDNQPVPVSAGVLTTDGYEETVDLRPMPSHLVMTGTEQSVRRKRVTVTEHRTWEILPRYGTAESDRWTVIGTPPPGEEECACIEDGQFSSLKAARHALAECIRLDDGTHMED